MSFREPDLVGVCGTMIVGVPCMAGLFIWAHPIGWWLTAAVVFILSTLHARVRVGRLVWTERRILGVPFQRRTWSRTVEMTTLLEWDLMCPSALALDDGRAAPLELYVSAERAEMIQDEVRRAVRRHARASAYRDAA